MPDSAAVRKANQRARERGELPPLVRIPCADCGRTHTGRHGQLCSRCWERLTPEGRANRLERVRRSQAKRKRDNL